MPGHCVDLTRNAPCALISHLCARHTQLRGNIARGRTTTVQQGLWPHNYVCSFWISSLLAWTCVSYCEQKLTCKYSSLVQSAKKSLMLRWAFHFFKLVFNISDYNIGISTSKVSTFISWIVLLLEGYAPSICTVDIICISQTSKPVGIFSVL